MHRDTKTRYQGVYARHKAGCAVEAGKRSERPFAVAPARTLEVAPLRVGCLLVLMLPDRVAE